MNNNLIVQNQETILVNPNPVCSNQRQDSLFDCLMCKIGDCSELAVHTDTINLKRSAYKVSSSLIDIPSFEFGLSSSLYFPEMIRSDSTWYEWHPEQHNLTNYELKSKRADVSACHSNEIVKLKIYFKSRLISEEKFNISNDCRDLSQFIQTSTTLTTSTSALIATPLPTELTSGRLETELSQFQNITVYLGNSSDNGQSTTQSTTTKSPETTDTVMGTITITAAIGFCLALIIFIFGVWLGFCLGRRKSRKYRSGKERN